MKKKFYFGIVFVLIFGGATVNVGLNSHGNSLSNLTIDKLNAFSACEPNIEVYTGGVYGDDDLYITILCHRKSTNNASQTGQYCTQSGNLCAYTSNGGGF